MAKPPQVPEEDLSTKLKLNQGVVLMVDLPPKAALVRPGAIGTVKSVSGWGGGKYRVEFKVPGDYPAVINIENVKREHLRIVTGT